jgi:Josephin
MPARIFSEVGKWTVAFPFSQTIDHKSASRHITRLFATMTTDLSSVWIYHERQEALLCGQHALNNLVQAPVFTTGRLADIARTCWTRCVMSVVCVMCLQ